jgi:hypothetical protein
VRYGGAVLVRNPLKICTAGLAALQSPHACGCRLIYYAHIPARGRENGRAAQAFSNLSVLMLKRVDIPRRHQMILAEPRIWPQFATDIENG